MARKRHNPSEIRFCQHNGHQALYQFKHDETAFLVKKEIESGHDIKIVVCVDCYEKHKFELVEELKVKLPK